MTREGQLDQRRIGISEGVRDLAGCVSERSLSAVSRLAHLSHDEAATSFVLGPPRSGTTWMLEILGAAGVLALFEPLSPDVAPLDLPGADQDGYVRLAIDQPAPGLETYLRNVARGRHIRRWTLKAASPAHVVRRPIVVKLIRMNRAAAWLRARFPRSPLVAVVRNPVSVVASMLNQPARWHSWDRDRVIALCAGRPEVREVLSGRASQLEIYAAFATVQMLDLLEQTSASSRLVVAYETLLGHPVGVAHQVFAHVGLAEPRSLDAVVRRPSALASHTRRGEGSTGHRVLLASDRARIIEIAYELGFAVYGEDPQPDLDALEVVASGGGPLERYGSQ